MYSAEIDEGIEAEGDLPFKEDSLKAAEADDALISAVFQQIRLPEVRYVQQQQQKTPPTTPKMCTPAPPNSTRRSMEMEKPEIQLEKLQLGPEGTEESGPGNGPENGPEDDQLEEQSMHLAAHRNSLQESIYFDEEQDEQEEEAMTPLGTLDVDTPSSGEDSARSIVTTVGETPRDTVEDGAEEGEQRGGSHLSQEIVNSAMDAAMQVYSVIQHSSITNFEEGPKSVIELDGSEANERESQEAGQAVQGQKTHDEEMCGQQIQAVHGQNEEKQEMPDQQVQAVPEVEKPLFSQSEENHESHGQQVQAVHVLQSEEQPKLRERSTEGHGHRLSELSHSSTYSGTSGQSTCPIGRDVHVRTPLNDPSTPFAFQTSTLVSAFEPEKQELIRREIGSTGMEGIRRIVNRFQSGSIQREEEQKWEEEKKPPPPFGRQRSAHFCFERMESAPKEQEDQPKRKNTPHPFIRQASLDRAEDNYGQEAGKKPAQIVVESQRRVADILLQFQQRDYQHANGKTAPLAQPANGTELCRQHSLDNGTTTMANGNDGNGCQQRGRTATISSVWANGKMREPPLGSMAAIRKSLGSVPPSPPNGTSKMAPAGNAGDGQSLKSGQTTPTGTSGGMLGKGGVQPKNVSQFYRLWGLAQAQSANE